MISDFLLSFFDIINLSHPTHHLSHTTHHIQAYNYSVTVKEALELSNHLVTPTAIYGRLSSQSKRDSESAAYEAAESAIFTLWAGSKSPPLTSSNATKYPPPALELLAVAPVTLQILL